MKKIITLFVLSITLLGCSNKNLDRDDAFDIIKQFYEYPNVEIINFEGVTSSSKLNKKYLDLRNNKFITQKRKGRYGDEFWVIMTEKGKSFTLSGKPNYNGYKVASSVLNLNEVTGIRLNDGKNTAYVDYTIKRKNITPFGKSKKYDEDDIIKKEIVMQLYDDGWRVTSEKNDNIIKTKDFKGFDEEYLSKLTNSLNTVNLETKVSPCFIKKINKSNLNTTIIVDYVVVDNVKGIINNNPKLRTFIINQNTIFKGPFGFEKIDDINELIEHQALFTISVQAGYVIELRFDYVTDGSDAG